MKFVLIATLLFAVASDIAAQNSPQNSYDKQAQLYSQVVRGERSFESLSPTEQSQVLAIQRLMNRSCSKLSGVCKEVCEAANELKDAADELELCANRHDYDDDCHRKFRDTRDAYDHYESAVSNSSGICS